MANRVEPNAQNSEKKMNGEASKSEGDKGLYGEILRPSEREDSYIPTQDKPEGNRSEVPDQHRRKPGTREQ